MFVKLRHFTNKYKFGILLVFALIYIFSLFISFSHPNGETGRTMQTTEGCGGDGCHGPAIPDPAIKISIASGSGSFMVQPSSVTDFAVTIDNPAGVVAGIDISIKDASGNNVGILTNIMNDLKVSNGELTQTAPKLMEFGYATYQFNWQAPDSQGTYTINIVGASCNNDGKANAFDSWNWMTPKDIVVSTGPPIMSITPSTLDFGEVMLNTFKDSVLLIKNLGNNTLLVTGIELLGQNAGEFSFPDGSSLFSLDPDSVTTLKVRFAPSSMTGTKQAQINFTNNSLDNPKIYYLTGSCNTRPHARISASPKQLDFGDVKVSQYLEKTVKITNTGETELQVTSTNLSGHDAKDFSFSNPTNFSLQADSSYIITVHFAPSSTGSKTAEFNFSSNSDSDVVVQLTGNGLPGPKPTLSFENDTIDFGSVAVGSKKDTIIQMKNTGELELDILLTKIIGPNGVEFSIVNGGGSFALQPNETRILTIRYSPIVDGNNKSAQVQFSSNDPDNPILHLTASAYSIPKPKIYIAKSSYNFGQVMLTRSSDTSFNIYNQGNLDLIIRQPVITGADSSDFTILSGPFPDTISQGSSYKMTINFKPSSLGDKTALLKIPSNDVEVDLQLSGKAVPFTFVADNMEISEFCNIYPNPGSGNIIISFSRESYYKVDITNISGKTVRQFSIFGKEIKWDMKDISENSCPDGIYFAIITKEEKRLVLKFIIER